jgi:hypothetical protein
MTLLLAGLPDFSWYKIPKREKIYQITTSYIYQMSIKYNYIKTVKWTKCPYIKYTNIFHCMTLQNLPKFGFLI